MRNGLTIEFLRSKVTRLLEGGVWAEAKRGEGTVPQLLTKSPLHWSVQLHDCTPRTAAWPAPDQRSMDASTYSAEETMQGARWYKNVS